LAVAIIMIGWGVSVVIRQPVTAWFAASATIWMALLLISAVWQLRGSFTAIAAMALASAVAYTAHEDAVTSRGHRVKRVELPIVVSDDVESVSKTSELVSFLEKVGLKEELERLYDGVKQNSGVSRLRGRSYRERVGPLVIVTNDRGVGRTAQSIPGVEVARVDSLNVLQLAPGGVPGRLTMWTESSLTALPLLQSKNNNNKREEAS